ncbi:MFS transporter [Marinomonas transparens]|uniref:MFS transporter n=1 Tax=Marinomonas transparens TaxID=2795388 RepID=A0A934JUP7_9GAMM|nr:MFS transporter [Marinomonas transparens]MBJ7537387.1 MFS transporter [Marinomonas transparens]
MKNTFRSLSNPQYRLWAIGAFISNIGTWLQRTAQDWIVIAELSDGNATAVGIVVALQFAPQFIFLPIIGWAADYFDRRKLLITTQTLRGLLALLQAVMILNGHLELWHMYIFAFLLGCFTAFDTPARHAFVADLVADKDLPNAVSLNSISFNSARMIGPAIAGFLILLIGAGWVFALNALSFLPILAIMFIIKAKPTDTPKVNNDTQPTKKTTLFDGFHYIRQRPDMIVAISMFFFFAMFGLNFTVYLSAMTVNVFTGNSQQFGILMSIMAIGSIVGAMITASRDEPNIRFISFSAIGFGVTALVTSIIPNFWVFALLLSVIGMTTQLFTTSVHSLVQLSAQKYIRGRVIAILLATSVGGTAIGGPLVGWVADLLGARWAIACGGIVALSTAAYGIGYLKRK